MADTTRIFNLNQLIDVALRVPEAGTVNFRILRIVLKIIVRELSIDDVFARVYVRDLQLPAAVMEGKVLNAHLKKLGLVPGNIDNVIKVEDRNKKKEDLGNDDDSTRKSKREYRSHDYDPTPPSSPEMYVLKSSLSEDRATHWKIKEDNESVKGDVRTAELDKDSESQPAKSAKSVKRDKGGEIPPPDSLTGTSILSEECKLGREDSKKTIVGTEHISQDSRLIATKWGHAWKSTVLSKKVDDLSHRLNKVSENLDKLAGKFAKQKRACKQKAEDDVSIIREIREEIEKLKQRLNTIETLNNRLHSDIDQLKIFKGEDEALENLTNQVSKINSRFKRYLLRDEYLENKKYVDARMDLLSGSIDLLSAESKPQEEGEEGAAAFRAILASPFISCRTEDANPDVTSMLKQEQQLDMEELPEKDTTTSSKRSTSPTKKSHEKPKKADLEEMTPTAERRGTWVDNVQHYIQRSLTSKKNKTLSPSSSPPPLISKKKDSPFNISSKKQQKSPSPQPTPPKKEGVEKSNDLNDEDAAEFPSGKESQENPAYAEEEISDTKGKTEAGAKQDSEIPHEKESQRISAPHREDKEEKECEESRYRGIMEMEADVVPNRETDSEKPRDESARESKAIAETKKERYLEKPSHKGFKETEVDTEPSRETELKEPFYKGLKETETHIQTKQETDEIYYDDKEALNKGLKETGAHIQPSRETDLEEPLDKSIKETEADNETNGKDDMNANEGQDDVTVMDATKPEDTEAVIEDTDTKESKIPTEPYTEQAKKTENPPISSEEERPRATDDAIPDPEKDLGVPEGKCPTEKAEVTIYDESPTADATFKLEEDCKVADEKECPYREEELKPESMDRHNEEEIKTKSTTSQKEAEVKPEGMEVEELPISGTKEDYSMETVSDLREQRIPPPKEEETLHTKDIAMTEKIEEEVLRPAAEKPPAVEVTKGKKEELSHHLAEKPPTVELTEGKKKELLHSVKKEVPTTMPVQEKQTELTLPITSVRTDLTLPITSEMPHVPSKVEIISETLLSDFEELVLNREAQEGHISVQVSKESGQQTKEFALPSPTYKREDEEGRGSLPAPINEDSAVHDTKQEEQAFYSLNETQLEFPTTEIQSKNSLAKETHGEQQQTEKIVMPSMENKLNLNEDRVNTARKMEFLSPEESIAPPDESLSSDTVMISLPQVNAQDSFISATSPEFNKEKSTMDIISMPKNKDECSVTRRKKITHRSQKAEEKADTSEESEFESGTCLARKPSKTTRRKKLDVEEYQKQYGYGATITDITEGLHELMSKVIAQEKFLQKAIDSINVELDTKVTKDELKSTVASTESRCKYLAYKLREIQIHIDQDTSKAAGVKMSLAKCISCDRPVREKKAMKSIPQKLTSSKVSLQPPRIKSSANKYDLSRYRKTYFERSAGGGHSVREPETRSEKFRKFWEMENKQWEEVPLEGIDGRHYYGLVEKLPPLTESSDSSKG